MPQKKNEKPQTSPTWFRLDNAAKIYPAIKRPNWSSVFRVSAILDKPIRPDLLQTALDYVLPRFPHLAVRIRHGLFWYYLEHNTNRLKVIPDASNPCMRVRWQENDGFLLRVRHYRNRIAVELFHALTDGTGAMAFLKTLTAEYLRQTGVQIPTEKGVLDITQTAEPEELEDAYSRYAGNHGIGKRREGTAWRVRGTKEPPDTIHIITGLIPIAPLSALCKTYKVTLTEMLVALFLLTLVEKKQAEDPMSPNPVKISVPVNLRQFFPSQTLRNFAFFVNPGVDARLGVYTLEETLGKVHHFMRLNVDPKLLGAQMTLNVRSERSPFLRPVPLFLKNFAMTMAYKQLGESQFSATLTNVGSVEVPPEMAAHVKRLDFLLGPPLTNPVNCAVVGYDGTLAVTFTRNIAESDIEREFFRKLVRLNIPVKIESNHL